jgi:RecB family exonuclease
MRPLVGRGAASLDLPLAGIRLTGMADRIDLRSRRHSLDHRLQDRRHAVTQTGAHPA